ncbi:MAG: hypothetical protein F6J86_13155 [Symploca sp. SIO1B1]|nr:hypothetical protein [Symploca sp. SIO1B1]
MGWRRQGKWLSHSNLTFSTKAPIGHLPTWHIFGGFLGGLGLLSMLETVDVTEKPILWQQLRSALGVGLVIDSPNTNLETKKVIAY